MIFKSQQLDLIYSQSSLIYEIIPDAPRSNTDPLKPKFGPHVDAIVGSLQNLGTLSNQMEKISIQSFKFGLASADNNPSQTTYVHTVKMSQKGNQPPNKNKKNNNNSNEKKGEGNEDNKQNHNACTGNKDCKKVRFPCKLCKRNHLTQNFPLTKEDRSLLE